MPHRTKGTQKDLVGNQGETCILRGCSHLPTHPCQWVASPAPAAPTSWLSLLGPTPKILLYKESNELLKSDRSKLWLSRTSKVCSTRPMVNPGTRLRAQAQRPNKLQYSWGTVSRAAGQGGHCTFIHCPCAPSKWSHSSEHGPFSLFPKCKKQVAAQSLHNRSELARSTAFTHI